MTLQHAIAAANAARDNHYELNPITGLYQRTLLLEGGITNLVANPDNPITGAGWSSDVAPTMAANVGTFGTTPLHLILRNGAAGANRRCAVAVASTGTYIASQLVKFGGEVGTMGFGVYDVTTGTWAMRAAVTFAADGTATIVASAGTLNAAIAQGNGVYQADVSAMLTAGHSYIYVVMDAGSGAGGIVGAPQLENNFIASSYNPFGVARAPDVAPQAFPYGPMEMTILAEFYDRGVSRFSSGVLSIGSAAMASANLQLAGTGAGFSLSYTNGTSVTSTVGGLPALRALVRLRAVLYRTGAVELFKSVNGGAEVSGGKSAALLMAASWSDQLLWYNALGNASATTGYCALRRLVVKRDVRTLGEMLAA